MSVFGYVRETRVVTVGDAPPGDVDTIDEASPANDLPETGNGFDEFRLPVSLDARDAEDLSWFHVEADIVDDADTTRPNDAEILNGQAFVWLGGCRSPEWLHPLSRRQRNLPAHH